MLHLLRMEYPLMTAAVVTVSDIFPVFGPGTVLLPLAVYRLLCGSAAQALGLFIGWIILSVIRQIIEPKLLANDAHPTRRDAFRCVLQPYQPQFLAHPLHRHLFHADRHVEKSRNTNSKIQININLKSQICKSKTSKYHFKIIVF